MFAIYTHFCLEGTELLGIESTLQLLHRVDWESDEAQDAVRQHFDLFFYENKGNAPLLKRVLDERARLPAAAVQIINETYAAR